MPRRGAISYDTDISVATMTRAIKYCRSRDLDFLLNRVKCSNTTKEPISHELFAVQRHFCKTQLNDLKKKTSSVAYVLSQYFPCPFHDIYLLYTQQNIAFVIG